MSFIEVIGRVIISFGVLLLMTRIMGKKQVSQLTYFNYITGITIGAVAASITIDTSIDMSDGFTSIVCWSLLTVLVSYINLKSPKARILLDGQPTIVIKNGEILEKTLAGLRLNMDDLSMLLREKNIFSTQEVDYAVLEPDGQLSVLKKVDQQSVTKKDLKVAAVKPLYVPTEIIVDSKVITQNLKELGLSQSWLEKQLHQSGVKLQDVFYGEIQNDGTLYIDKRQDN
ncbi:DUF421 domain-containing protein [Priestia megaterium]|uniref:DUF421 domain-containing protein n=1 Tax=Priestia megaterium TaxID=1404 RepID=UPI0024528AD1|nr:DUF421 domain-containing protein [Priestia megaterium]MDH3144499.1 DUF421 domain-containing protein [Priestia megaterium]MED4240880.1 DUF421 domain-containing protein [Priestia megaterium]MED4268104.1 DUF421 domain-containing protein [Priestia megaterium]MED4279509.1 DUF421 domain-containing protein [Priestia megaterium]MED4319025.1 DUF421 domain-containing protein [Priestia megaterium]